MSSNDLDLDFSRWIDGFKLSTISAIVGQFSTRKPTQITLTNVFLELGKDLRLLLGADNSYHIFLNSDLKEAHILDCGSSGTYCQKKKANITIESNPKDPLALLYYKKDQLGFLGEICDSIHSPTENGSLYDLIGNPSFYVIASLCQRGIPLGYFVFTWNDDNTLPELFQKNAEIYRESISNIFYYIENFTIQLFTNHYPIHRDTYLPSYMESRTKHISILFADIRNYTAAFEAMRLHRKRKEKYINPLVGLAKAYLAASSLIIAEPGIGTIDKFIGDGVMATFGEYICCKSTDDNNWQDNIYQASCLLSIYSAAMLKDAFDKLFSCLLKRETIIDFMKEYNERLDLKLGVGINFGEVNFDYFGTSMDASRLIGGYLEFTAIGDNVNMAQRLESLANKPVNDISLVERSPHWKEKNFTAPIIVSRTTFLRIQGILHRQNSNSWLADSYKAVVSLKGKGSLAEIYEIDPDDINWNAFRVRLGEIGLQRIDQEYLKRKYWNTNSGKFEFPKEKARELIDQYCEGV